VCWSRANFSRVCEVVTRAFRRFHLCGGSLGVKIKPGGLTDHQIARVLIIELGGLLLFFAGLPVVVGVAVNQRLAG
jgi:hypothetical protein